MHMIQLPIAGIIISLLLLFLFFSKKNVNNEETYIYKNMLLVNFVFNILSIIIIIYALNIGNKMYIGIMQKVYISMMVLLVYLILKYNLTIAKLTNKVFSIISDITNLVLMVLTIISKMYVINEPDLLDGYGPSYNIAIGTTIVYFAFIILTTFYIFIKHKKNIKKDIPLAILVILFAFGLYMRGNYPYIMFETFFFSFVMLVMYFTIENPDVKILEELTKSKELNDKVNAEKSNIMYRITDTIRKPISEIKEISDYILTQNINDDVRNATSDIKDKSYELYNTVNSILNISSSDTRAINLVDTSYNVKNLFGGVYLQLKGDVKEGVDFRLELSDTLPEELIGDSVKIKQIVNTLVLNSAKYTDEGFIALNVDAIVKYDVCKLIITIEDTGSGMDMDKVNHLLEVKEALSAEELKKLEGKDLNIDIVNKLVYMIGGTINIKSIRKEGTKVTISLDQKIKSEKEDERIKKLYDYGNREFNKKKVYIVTEDTNFSKKTSKMLTDLNLNVDSVVYAKEVLDKVREGEKVDLIITEENLSKIGGHLLMEKLNKEPGFGGKVVLVSDEQNESLINKALDEGFYRVLNYNFTKNDISDIVKKI